MRFPLLLVVAFGSVFSVQSQAGFFRDCFGRLAAAAGIVTRLSPPSGPTPPPTTPGGPPEISTSYTQLNEKEELELYWGVGGDATRQAVLADWYQERGKAFLSGWLRHAALPHHHALIGQDGRRLDRHDAVQALLPEWQSTKWGATLEAMGATLHLDALTGTVPPWRRAHHTWAIPLVRVSAEDFYWGRGTFYKMPMPNLSFQRIAGITEILPLWNSDDFARQREDLVLLELAGNMPPRVEHVGPYDVPGAEDDNLRQRKEFIHNHEARLAGFPQDARPIAPGPANVVPAPAGPYMALLRQLITPRFPNFSILLWQGIPYSRQQLQAVLATIPQPPGDPE